jgi:hypothetical protein
MRGRSSSPLCHQTCQHINVIHCKTGMRAYSVACKDLCEARPLAQRQTQLDTNESEASKLTRKVLAGVGVGGLEDLTQVLNFLQCWALDCDYEPHVLQMWSRGPRSCFATSRMTLDAGARIWKPAWVFMAMTLTDCVLATTDVHGARWCSLAPIHRHKADRALKASPSSACRSSAAVRRDPPEA